MGYHLKIDKVTLSKDIEHTKCFIVFNVAEDYTEYDIIVPDIDRGWNKIPRQFSD